MSREGVTRYSVNYNANPELERGDGLVENNYDGYYVTYDAYMALLREYADYRVSKGDST